MEKILKSKFKFNILSHSFVFLTSTIILEFQTTVKTLILTKYTHTHRQYRSVLLSSFNSKCQHILAKIKISTHRNIPTKFYTRLTRKFNEFLLSFLKFHNEYELVHNSLTKIYRLLYLPWKILFKLPLYSQMSIKAFKLYYLEHR